MMSDEEDFDCPLCMEELDISDRNFRPCPCGYQICRFCWHHIKEDLNGRCPACRRIYSEETVEFTPISADELAMIKNEKKAKEREKKEMEAMNRKHLSNMRVVQKSLVYVIGLPTKLANDEHALRQHEYFGQYGKISKVVINRRNAPMPVPGSPGQPSVGVYITYIRKEDAAKAIAAIDGSIWDGKILRASYGTTKYCTYYLRGMACQNPGCMYLHEPGEDADSFTKEDLASGYVKYLEDNEPTPAEALAIEAAAKERMLQEQRQLQEQQRKQQLLQQKQDQQEESLEQQTEVLNRKLRKQRMQEQEQERLELQKQQQQHEMEQRLQSQKEKEQALKEKKLQEEREAGEREEKESLEQERRELEEQERRLAQSQADLFVSAPPLSLGSFSFNPDASLSTLPLSFGNGSGLLPLGSESVGAFGLDSFSAFSNMPLTPGHYTGSFNPFSMDDEPLMRRSMAPPTRSFLDDADYDPMTGRNRPVGPPIPGKPRQTSRFGFAMENQQGETFGRDGYADPSQSMQDGFRALFPNVNVSFGAGDSALNLQQQQQQLRQQQYDQQQQQQQQQQYQTSPSLRRREEMSNPGMWGSADKQESPMFQRSMSQLNMDPVLTTPSSRMAEYHQQLQMQQQHSQRNGPPGIARGTINPSMMKSPPPGLESVARNDSGQWPGSQQQQQQQHQRPHQMSRMGGWGLEGSRYLNGSSTPGVNQESNPQDFFSSFLKAAAASPQNQSATLAHGGQGSDTSFQDPAIMTARFSAAGTSRSSLVEALQTPAALGGVNGYRMTQDPYGTQESSLDSDKSGGNNSVQRHQSHPQQQQQAQQVQRQSTPDSPSSLQSFPLGSKRKEIKSVKGVLNSGMNAPLSGGSRSRPSSTPGSPLVEPRLQLHQPQQQQPQQPPTAFGAGESPMMASAAARSAKVKSDLLMGLNSPSIRSERFSSSSNNSSSKDQSEPNSNGQYGGMMNGFPGSTNKSSIVSGPPPGLGMPLSSSGMMNNQNQGGDGGSSNSNSPYMMANGLSSFGSGLSTSKPMDVASMMSALDFFGPGGSSGSGMMGSPNWASLGLGNGFGSSQLGGPNGNSGNSNMQHWSQSQSPSVTPSQTQSQSAQSQGNKDENSSTNGSAGGTPTLSAAGSVSGQGNSGAGTTARSVEDLELQVINAKMETQMLENQLNAVIKRNRRKIYA
ncbi:transcriptional repressor general negative regulator of transcription subunit 4 [Gryganskiella cystojenkinii]|nr:transcriptional repressor general negative regulator of transcription subunit 4 [Gryganskiella cystojenkinii]